MDTAAVSEPTGVLEEEVIPKSLEERSERCHGPGSSSRTSISESPAEDVWRLFFVAIHGWHYALEDEEVRKCFIVLGEPLLELMKARYNRGDLLSTSFERGLYRAEAIEMGREWPGWIPPARSGMKIALA